MISDFSRFRTTAIRYWERRRALYNFALIPPSLLTYLIGASIVSGGDAAHLNLFLVVVLFAVCAVGANICYTFVYAVEFLWGSDDPSSHWLMSGRTTLFVAGTLFSMLLAAAGGHNIAVLEFDWNARQARTNSSFMR